MILAAVPFLALVWAGPAGAAGWPLVLWTYTYDGAGTKQCSGSRVAVDASSNAYMVGGCEGVTRDVVVVKVGPDGNMVWDRVVDLGYFEHANSVMVASDGSAIYTVGTYNPTTGTPNYLLTKMDQSSVVWTRTYDSGSDDYGYSLARDGTGNLYVSGSYNNTTGPARVVKYDPAGDVQWTADWAEAGAMITSLHVSAAGDLYGADNSDSFLRAFKADKANGATVFEYTATRPDPSSVERLVVDGSGNVYVTGRATISGNSRMLVAKYSAAGSLVWSSTLGGTMGSSYGGDLLLDGSGNLYVAGQDTGGALDRSIIAKYVTDGTLIWSMTWGGTGGKSHLAGGLALDAAGNVIFGGVMYATDAFYFVTKLMESPPADLSATMFYSQAIAGVGQNFGVYFTVSNTGPGTVTGVYPHIDVNAGPSFSLITGPTPSGPVSLPAGASQSFTWVYSAAASGTMFFTATATGSNYHTGAAVVGAQYGQFQVVDGAKLSAEKPSFSLASPSVGEVLEIAYTVTNTGQYIASGVGSNLQFNKGAANVSFISKNPSGALGINPGSSQTITWTYNVVGAGLVEATVTSTGTDAVLSIPVSVSKTNSLTTLAAAALTSTISTDPGPYSVGQSFQVRMTFTNTGGVRANSVMAYYQVNASTGGVALRTTPTDGASVNPSAQATYTWTFTATGGGAVNLSFTVIGTDANTGQAVVSSRLLGMNFLSGANLVGAVAQTPANQSTGLDVTIDYTVSNTGGVTANSVTPALNINTNGGLVSYKSGPTPANAGIPPGGMQTFSWTYSVSGGGVASITYTATGTDAGSGYTVQDVRTVPLGLISGARLETAISANPATPSVGQTVAIALTVSNTGGVDAVNVDAFRQVNMGSGLVSYQSRAPVGTVGVVLGTFQVFTYQYLVTDAGPIQFTVTAIGNDLKAGYTVLSASTISLSSIQGAVLEPTLSFAPSAPLVGEWMSVVLNVSNPGNVAAAGVKPGIWFTSGGNLVELKAGPTPAGPVTVAASGQQSFTWTYSISGKGTIAFTVTAQGYDQNSKGIVSAVESRSFSVTKTRLPGGEGSGLVIAPNVLDYSIGNAFVNFVFRGDPGGTVDLRIYNEAGRLVLSRTVGLESGQKVFEFDGRGGDRELLGSGVYWVVANGGGVKAKKPLVVVTKRKK